VGALTLLRSPTWAHASTWWVGLGALVVLGGLAMASALRPITESQDPRGARLLAAGGIALGALGALGVGSDGRWGGAGGLRCVLVGSLVALPVFVAARLLDRAPWRGVLFGALAGGITGTVALQLVCPVPHLGHLLVGHFGALLVSATVFGGLGGLLARRA